MWAARPPAGGGLLPWGVWLVRVVLVLQGSIVIKVVGGVLLEFALVGSVEELCDQATRLHFVRYVRPALRYYCEKLGHEIPAWLEDDATVTSLSDDEKQRLFGKPRFSLPTFKKVKTRASRGQVQREAE